MQRNHGQRANCRGLRVKVVHLRLTLGNPTDYNPPGSSVQVVLQTRILEWVAIPFSRGSSQPRDRTQDPCIENVAS